MQSDDFKPRRIEMDRNPWKNQDLSRERILGDDHQNPIIWMKLTKVGVEMLYVQSRIHSNYDSAESVSDSDLEDGELRKMLASPLHVHGRGDYGSSQKTTASGKPEAVIIQKRGQVHNVLKLIIQEERA